jgi:cytochrome P450
MDQRACLDELRERCPVADDGAGTWTLLRHADIVAAACDPVRFSSRVSRYLQVPNGMDGDEHARFRTVVDRYFEPRRVAQLEPRFRACAADLVRSLPRGETIDAVGVLGAPYAVRAQSAWLGWPAELEDTLVAWMGDNREAARSKMLAQTTAVAERFDAIIASLVAARREAGDEAPDDVTTEIVRDTVDGRALTEEEIVSILRNWTAGDLGSIALCLGVVVHHLVTDPALQAAWRTSPPPPVDMAAAVDEILRIDDPFVSNRRITTTDVRVAGRAIPAGQRVVLNWTAANRDPEAFGDPDAFRPAENAARNLVYGTGPHACPGRGVATLELRVAVEELLAATEAIEPAPDARPEREAPPVGGYRTVPVVLR